MSGRFNCEMSEELVGRPMESWTAVQDAFKALAPGVKGVHLVRDCPGDGSEQWHLSDAHLPGGKKQAAEEFALLCARAGKLLPAVIPQDDDLATLLVDTDPAVAWYRLMRARGVGIKPGLAGWLESLETGRRDCVSSETMGDLGEGAANLALWLDIYYPIELPRRAWYALTANWVGQHVMKMVVGVVIVVIAAAVLAYLGIG